MEKIYDEQSKKKKQKQIQIDGTSALSFLVAVFAIVSLVSFGISGGLNTSYALPQVTQVPPEFEGGSKTGDGYWFIPGGGEFDFHTGNVGGQSFPVYCLQQATGFGHGSTYTQGSDITDGGLIYLLANIYPNAEVGIVANNFTTDHKPGDTGMATVDKAGQYVAQAMIWKYLKDKNVSGNSDAKIDAYINAKAAYSSTEFDDANLLFQLTESSTLLNSFTFKDADDATAESAATLLQNAKNITEQPATFVFNKGEAKTGMTNNNKYYTYGPLSASGGVTQKLGEYKGYTVSFSGSVPSGTIISDGEGNKLPEGKVYTDSDRFFISIPVASVKESTDIKVLAEAKFERYAGSYYTTTDKKQEITTVRYVPFKKSDGATFTVAPAPDTGMSSAQTIYFIGLVVLLCGVGIIYANAKPSAQKQAQQEQ